MFIVFQLSQHRSEVLTKLESADEDRKNVAANSESLREQLIHAKVKYNLIYSLYIAFDIIQLIAKLSRLIWK